MTQNARKDKEMGVCEWFGACLKAATETVNGDVYCQEHAEQMRELRSDKDKGK